MSLISLIIPTLNEEESIQELLFRMEKVAQEIKKHYSLEIIIVDDNSSDRTVSEILAFGPGKNFNLRLIQRSEYGLASAVLAGFNLAKGDFFSVIDADLSHPPEILVSMTKKIGQAEIIIASRLVKGGMVENWPFHRKILSNVGIWLTRLIGVKAKDPLSGFFILEKKVVENASLHPLGYKILLEILLKGNYENFLEIPYLFKNRDVGKSKINLKVEIDYLKHFFLLFLWKYFKK